MPASGETEYDLSVYGPNGFLRTFKGSFLGSNKVNLATRVIYDADRCGVTLQVRNDGTTTRKVRIAEAYGQDATTLSLSPGENRSRFWNLENSFCWYDFNVECDADASFQQRLAGHVETGKHSVSDPALGAAAKS